MSIVELYQANIETTFYGRSYELVELMRGFLPLKTQDMWGIPGRGYPGTGVADRLLEGRVGD